MNVRGSKTHTIVMQSSWELHNIITYLHNLIHLISIGDASSPPLVELALPYDPQGRWWEWGNNSMYRRCLQLARWWLEYDPLWWKGRFRPTSAQCPQVGAFRFSHQTLFFIKCKVQTPSLMWLNKRVCFVLTSHERNMARSKRLFTTSCTMKCCESESAMMKEIIHEQMKMFWQNFSLQV